MLSLGSAACADCARTEHDDSAGLVVVCCSCCCCLVAVVACAAHTVCAPTVHRPEMLAISSKRDETRRLRFLTLLIEHVNNN